LRGSGWGSSGERQIGFFTIGQELDLIENTGHGNVKQKESFTHIPFDLLNERARFSRLVERLIVDVTLFWLKSVGISLSGLR
jgi:hypothetical protein